MQFNWLDATVKKLSSGFPEQLVILDCETTGGKATYHRITEIGLLIVERGEVIERWQTFINPQTSIPANIQALTGITPAMVASAPLFEDIANELLEKLKGRTLVAHFARFDYGFLKNEFARAGINYSSKPLCSVKFSRALFPQFRHHGLDAIIKRFNFTIVNRHRAFDDADIIHQLFLKSSSLFEPEDIAAACDKILQRPTLPIAVANEVIEALPNTPGVYYFYDSAGKILYIGKSVNIRTRVLSHFNQDHKNPKDLTLSQKIAHIEHQTTPSDFGAQILESTEIKKHSPFYNRRLKKVKKLYQIKTRFINGAGNNDTLQVHIETINTETLNAMPNENHHGLFRSKRHAQEKLRALADTHFLCTQTMGLDGSKPLQATPKTRTQDLTPCFRFQLKKCLGACCNIEPVANHNERLQQALARYQMQVWPFDGAIIIEEKNTDKTFSVYHLVDRWCYLQKLTHPNDIYDLGYRFKAPHYQDQTQLDPTTDNTSEFSPPLTASLSLRPNAGSQPGSSGLCSDDDQQFNFDTYFILARFLLKSQKHAFLTVHELIND